MIYFQSQVDRLLKAKDEQIADLKAALDLEKTRANNAVDNLLFMAGSNRITPVKIQEREPMKDLLAEVSSELGQVGLLPDEIETKAANDK